MAAAAGAFVVGQCHVMQPAGITRLSHPTDKAGLLVLAGQNLFEMAGPAGDRQVDIVCDRLVVAHVALTAIARLLARMSVLGRFRMTS